MRHLWQGLAHMVPLLFTVRCNSVFLFHARYEVRMWHLHTEYRVRSGNRYLQNAWTFRPLMPVAFVDAYRFLPS
ncbi:hypothetical protein J3E69DRAFT_337692 [Trichoderma sp. SZMC 28015]